MKFLRLTIFMARSMHIIKYVFKYKKISATVQQNKNRKFQNVKSWHYENTPMLNIDLSLVVKIENFQQKIFDIFLIFAQNIDCGYTLEPPRLGGPNEYPQSMFWSKENRYTPAHPSFTI